MQIKPLIFSITSLVFIILRHVALYWPSLLLKVQSDFILPEL